MAADKNLAVALRLRAAVDGLSQVADLVEGIERVGDTASQASDGAQALDAGLKGVEAPQGVDESLAAIGQAAEDAAGQVGELGDTAESVGALNEELEDTEEGGDEASSVLLSAAKAALALAGINIGIGLVSDLAAIAQEAREIETRLKLTTAGTEEYTRVSQELFNVAQRTGTSLSSTALLYDRLDDAVKSVGGSTEDAVRATETINQAFAISGGSAEANTAAIIQLAQGLASGTLRGDELNSVLEQAPRLAQAFAAGIGISRGELRALAEDGKLTPQILLDALANQAPKIAEEFAQVPRTIGQAFTSVRDILLVTVGALDNTTGASDGVTAAIDGIGTAINELAQNGGLDVLAGTATAAAGVVGFAFSTLSASIKGVKLAVELAAAAITFALSTVTVGRISDEFAAVSRSLIKQSQQTAESIANDAVDSEAAFAKVAAGVEKVGEGLEKTGGSAKVADGEFKGLDASLVAVDAAAVRLATDSLPQTTSAAAASAASFDALGQSVTAAAEAAFDKIPTLNDVIQSIGASARTAEQEATAALKIYAEIDSQLEADRQGRDQLRAESVGQAKSEYEGLRQAVAAATDLGEIQQLRQQNTTFFAEGKIGFQEYQQVIADTDTQLQQLADNTAAGYDALFGLIGQLRASYAEVSAAAAAAFDDINERAGRSGILVGRYLREINDGVLGLNRSVAEQARQADQLIANLDSVGRFTENNIRLAQQAADSFQFLDGERLSGLQSAIDAATRRLESLRDTARDTLSSVRDELDQLRGNEDAIQRRRDQARRAEVTAQLEQARAFGDQESIRQLQETLGLLDQIGRERERQRQAEASARQANAPRAPGNGREPAAPTTPTQAPTTRANEAGPTPRTRDVVRVELVLPGRSAPLAGDFAPSDADQLLRFLDQQRSVSLTR